MHNLAQDLALCSAGVPMILTGRSRLASNAQSLHGRLSGTNRTPKPLNRPSGTLHAPLPIARPASHCICRGARMRRSAPPSTAQPQLPAVLASEQHALHGHAQARPPRARGRLAGRRRLMRACGAPPRAQAR